MVHDVIVVGAINHDLLLRVERNAEAGETILARSLLHASGGKGANQAAAAARTGARTALVSAVGQDEIGAAEVEALRRVGVTVDEVVSIVGQPTGMAVITVNGAGENSIVVALGANAHIAAARVEASLARTAGEGSIVVLQTEAPLQAVEAGARHCAANGLRAVVNNGPCVALPKVVTAVADPLVVNETEASQMIGSQVGGHQDSEPSAAASLLLERSGAKSVVLTLGARGAYWHDLSGSGHVPAQSVQVVDTTGAGDAFIGTLAAALASGETLGQACALANAAAGQAVTWTGARPP